MGNCIHVKLKGSIISDNLPELEALKINVLNSQGAKKTIPRMSGYNASHPVTAKIDSGTFYRYGTDTDLGSVYNLPSGNVGEENPISFIASANTIIHIKNIYNLGRFRVNKYNAADMVLNPNFIAESVIFNLSSFKYCEHLVQLEGAADWVGDILELSNCINITSINFQGGKLTGQIEDLVKSWISNGRASSGSISLSLLGAATSLFTKNDFALQFGTKNFKNDISGGTLTWESSTKMYLIQAYVSNVYYVGNYSAEEIAAKTASGGAWEGKTPVNCTKTA